MKNRIVIAAVIVGAVGGFFYWKYIGCMSGTCRIKSVWYMSTLYGAIIGYIVGDIIKVIKTWLMKRKG